ncbi:MAG: hypothetical protein LBS95_02590 [Mycoplasmataceae bacterium]|nr:hypothetical protein [Mycoplasmataceae bacterium]
MKVVKIIKYTNDPKRVGDEVSVGIVKKNSAKNFSDKNKKPNKLDLILKTLNNIDNRLNVLEKNDKQIFDTLKKHEKIFKRHEGIFKHYGDTLQHYGNTLQRYENIFKRNKLK